MIVDNEKNRVTNPLLEIQHIYICINGPDDVWSVLMTPISSSPASKATKEEREESKKRREEDSRRRKEEKAREKKKDKDERQDPIMNTIRSNIARQEETHLVLNKIFLVNQLSCAEIGRT